MALRASDDRLAVVATESCDAHDVPNRHPEAPGRLVSAVAGVRSSVPTERMRAMTPLRHHSMTLYWPMTARISTCSLRMHSREEANSTQIPTPPEAHSTRRGVPPAQCLRLLMRFTRVERNEHSPSFARLGITRWPIEAMGFCLVNNVAVAASKLRSERRACRHYRLGCSSWEWNSGHLL